MPGPQGPPGATGATGPQGPAGPAVTVDATPTNGSGNAVSSDGVFDALAGKQDALVSGTTLKTINSTSLLGSGDLTVSASPGGSTTQVQFNDAGAFAGDAGLLYNKTAKKLSVVGLGTISFEADATSAYVTHSDGTFAFQGGGGYMEIKPKTGNIKFYNGGWLTGIGSNAADLMQVNNGTIGTFRDLKLRNLIGAVGGNLYTYNLDTDASNYERGFMRWNSNVLEIGTEALGTGVRRDITFICGTNATRGKLKLTNTGYDPQFESLLQIHFVCNQSVYFRTGNGIRIGADDNSALQIGPAGITTDNYGAPFIVKGHTRPVDEVRQKLQIIGGPQHSSATVNLVGGGVDIIGGAGASGSAGAAHGGNVKIAGGTGYGTGKQGVVAIKASNEAPEDANLSNSDIAFYLDQSGNNLKVRVKYSDGTLKTATIALT